MVWKNRPQVTINGHDICRPWGIVASGTTENQHGVSAL
jgi:hypothetical protein